MQTIQQHRAGYSLQCIEKAQRDGENGKTFKARAGELPAMIQMNGLGQAAAFYRMKGSTNGHAQLYGILSTWLCRAAGDHTTEAGIYHPHKDLIHGIANANMHDYRVAQAEALALMEWVKRFAKAFMADAPANHDRQSESDDAASV